MRAVDVLEIDAASNRGIDEIRELRESVRYLPSRDRNKVFIIDEVHMLTPEAFNALLKTLEEPPESVLFILATTEPHQDSYHDSFPLPALCLPPAGLFGESGAGPQSGRPGENSI